MLASIPLVARGEPPSGAAPPQAPAAAVAGDAIPPAPGDTAPPAVDFRQLHREAAESFYATDGDRDGFVMALEAMEMTPESFQAADRDRDGKLTLVEWVDARFEAVAAPRASPAAPSESQAQTAEP